MATQTDDATTHRVSLINQGGDYFVTPRAREVMPEDTVIFKRVGPVGTIQLFFPNPDLFDTQVVTLNADQDSVELIVQEEAVPDPYPYAVYHEKTKQFVRATPDPIIIVY